VLKKRKEEKKFKKDEAAELKNIFIRKETFIEKN